MILHLSISAQDPRRVASVLAELWGSRALPCPHPIEGGWIAFADDGRGTAVEVYPLGHVLVPGPAAVTHERSKARASASHFAMTTKLSAAKVKAIAKREGWRVLVCDRGPYEVLELWLEDERLVEVLTEEMLADYVASMTPASWEKMFSE